MFMIFYRAQNSLKDIIKWKTDKTYQQIIILVSLIFNVFLISGRQTKVLMNEHVTNLLK